MKIPTKSKEIIKPNPKLLSFSYPRAGNVSITFLHQTVRFCYCLNEYGVIVVYDLATNRMICTNCVYENRKTNFDQLKHINNTIFGCLTYCPKMFQNFKSQTLLAGLSINISFFCFISILKYALLVSLHLWSFQAEGLSKERQERRTVQCIRQWVSPMRI